MRSEATHLTAATLIGLAVLHVAWGRGSSFPLADRDDLAEAVVGTSFVPGPLPCFGVAAALLVASSAVQNRPRWPRRLRRLTLAWSPEYWVVGAFSVWPVRPVWCHPAATGPASGAWTAGSMRRLCLGLAAGVLGA